MQPGRSYIVSPKHWTDALMGGVPVIDRLVIEADGLDLKVIRAMIGQAVQQPFGSVRLIVIHGADLLTEAAQNTLLKLLEEPPPFLIVVLVAARAEGLLPTVRSRLHNLGLVQESPAKPPPVEPVKLEELKRGLSAAKDRAALATFLGGLRDRVSNNLLNEPRADLVATVDLLDRSIRRLAHNVNQKLIIDALLLNWPTQSSRSEVGK